jgi:hypothetical protein
LFSSDEEKQTKFNVAEREKTELLTAPGGMKGDIVGA